MAMFCLATQQGQQPRLRGKLGRLTEEAGPVLLLKKCDIRLDFSGLFLAIGAVDHRLAISSIRTFGLMLALGLWQGVRA